MTALRYPSEFKADAGTDYLEMKFIRKDYKGSGTYVKEGVPIILNVPQKVTEQMSQQFNNTTKGELGPFFTNGGNGIVNGAALQNVARRFIENFALNKSVEVANKLGASQLTDNGILSATSGIVFNPNLEVLYEGPDFRSFNFQFTMFTKSAKDAKAIFSIVDTLRKASLPSAKANLDAKNLTKTFANVANIKSGEAVTGGAFQALGSLFSGQVNFNGLIGGLAGAAGVAGAGLATSSGLIFNTDGNRFIKQPPFVLITYKRGAKQHPFIKPLLPAAINSINFDFTPTGNYTQLSNFDATDQATTVGVVITMQVTEVTNLFSDTLFNNPAPGVS
tara:strand:- start:2293 stop:3294 length:1002 start_codon:yes stop_codon:yes gene_type:complete